MCCYDTEMPLTEGDVARLVALGFERGAFSRRGEDGVLYLQTVEGRAGDPGRPCFFLREGRCGAYEARPEGCRIYPFVLRVDDGRVVRDEDCPWRAEFPRDPALERRLRRVVSRLESESRVARGEG